MPCPQTAYSRVALRAGAKGRRGTTATTASRDEGLGREGVGRRSLACVPRHVTSARILRPWHVRGIIRHYCPGKIFCPPCAACQNGICHVRIEFDTPAARPIIEDVFQRTAPSTRHEVSVDFGGWLCRPDLATSRPIHRQRRGAGRARLRRDTQAARRHRRPPCKGAETSTDAGGPKDHGEASTLCHHPNKLT